MSYTRTIFNNDNLFTRNQNNIDHSFKVSKRNGKFRTVYVPTKEVKDNIKLIFKKFNKLQEFHIEEFGLTDSIHGFVKGKNPVSNAKQHIGYDYTISIDLEDFFDTVSYSNVKEFFTAPPKTTTYEGSWSNKGRTFKGKYTKFFQKSRYLNSRNFVLYELLHNKRVPQGFPTSPILANLGFLRKDKELQTLISDFLHQSDKLSEDFVYTRYADDINVSFKVKEGEENKGIYPILNILIKKIVSCIQTDMNYVGKYSLITTKSRFKVNKNKTAILNAKCGDRNITGIMVGKEGITTTHKTKNKLRAAKHQNNTNSISGLEEWSKLKDCDKNICNIKL